MKFLTFLNLPSIKDFDIRQKLGSGVNIVSVMFLTMDWIASQTSFPPDWAVVALA